MSEQHNQEVAVPDASSTGVARTQRFDDPGLPPHRDRLTDIDPRAAKRAERQVAGLFALSALGTVVALVAYFLWPLGQGRGSTSSWGDDYAAYLTDVRLSTTFIGLGMFLALFCIGAGAVHLAKTLMPDDEKVELRHDLRGTDANREAAVAILKEGAAEAGLGRRPLIRNSLIGAMALAPLPGVVMLRDLGPLPGTKLAETVWEKGEHLITDPQGEKIKASDLVNGTVVHVLPEKLKSEEEASEAGLEYLNEKAKAAVLLIRLEPEKLDETSRAGAYEGIVAYSKICTHMGCPVALYEQQTHHLLCPCHQSTFDLTQNCKVIFGPAKRPLPQLPITVDDEGYLVAADGFGEPAGPSYWERT